MEATGTRLRIADGRRDPTYRPSTAIGVVVALGISAFVYVTTENLPIGLITLIAGDLHTSVPSVGLLVTGYAVTVAVVSVPLTRLTGGIPRRALISGLLAGFVLATLVAAVSANYWVLLAARVVTALTQAVFWAVVAPTAAGMFPPRVRGRVIAMVMASASLGTLLGVPAGTWLGQRAGWRVSFAALSCLGLLALVAVATLLPTIAPGDDHAATGTAPDRARLRILVVVTTLAITGMFTAQTYIVVFLTEVSGFSQRAVSPLLLLQGLMDLLGVFVAGVVADRWPRWSLPLPVGLLAAAMLGLFAFGGVPQAAAVAVGLTGFALAGVPLAAQTRIMQIAPGSTAIASAWNSAAFNVGIAGGALLGGVLLPWSGARGTALAAGLIVLVALAVVLSEPLLVGDRAGAAGAAGSASG
jgi:DHA1 family inner membrane transport protein